MSEATTSVEPEVFHLIGLLGGAHGYAKLTATREDGRIERQDGRGPWEPLEDDGSPAWFRVSREIAEEWTVDDDDEPTEASDAAANAACAAYAEMTGQDPGVVGLETWRAVALAAIQAAHRGA